MNEPVINDQTLDFLRKSIFGEAETGNNDLLELASSEG